RASLGFGLELSVGSEGWWVPAGEAFISYATGARVQALRTDAAAIAVRAELGHSVESHGHESEQHRTTYGSGGVTGTVCIDGSCLWIASADVGYRRGERSHDDSELPP